MALGDGQFQIAIAQILRWRADGIERDIALLVERAERGGDLARQRDIEWAPTQRRPDLLQLFGRQTRSANPYTDELGRGALGAHVRRRCFQLQRRELWEFAFCRVERGLRACRAQGRGAHYDQRGPCRAAMLAHVSPPPRSTTARRGALAGRRRAAIAVGEDLGRYWPSRPPNPPTKPPVTCGTGATTSANGPGAIGASLFEGPRPRGSASGAA